MNAINPNDVLQFVIGNLTAARVSIDHLNFGRTKELISEALGALTALGPVHPSGSIYRAHLIQLLDLPHHATDREIDAAIKAVPKKSNPTEVQR